MKSLAREPLPSLYEAPFCSESPSFLSSVMARTRGGHSASFRPRIRPSSPPQNPRAPAMPPPATPPAAAEPPAEGLVIAPSAAPPAAAPKTHRYYTRTRALPPSPPHRRPCRRALPSKRARTSGPGETSRSQPQGPSTTSFDQAPSAENPLALSPHCLIRRPLFHCGPIEGNADCSDKSFHNENYYHFPAFAALLELRDPMRLVQRYFLEPFMVPQQYFYPQVVYKFYQTMTSRGEQHPIALHFSIDGR